MSGSQIADLATRIAANTAKVNQYYHDRKLPLPSFETNGPLKSLISPEAEDVEAARQAVIFECQELRSLMLGPSELLMDFGVLPSLMVPLQGIAGYGLASAVPVDGEATFAQIAARTAFGETHVRRLLRGAMAQHIFREPHPGVVAHTAASRALAEDELLRQSVAWITVEGWKASYHTCEAMVKWPDSEEPDQAGFSLAHGKAMFSYLSEHPDSLKRFADFSRYMTESPALEPHHIVNGYPWGELPAGATVVDVGGNHGVYACAIARAFSSLKVVVQDLDERVIRAAEAKRPADVADRVQYTVHDFLTEQPVRGADVYFFRGIMHNWPDKYVVRILRNLIPAFKPGSKVVIADLVIPEPCTAPFPVERYMRAANLIMTTNFNATDRELAEVAKLFEAADPGFRFKGVKTPPGSQISFFEAEWEGDNEKQ